jgi:hypothetical protein
MLGHDGIAVNITMLPGDLVLYESHSILHGESVLLSFMPLSVKTTFCLLVRCFRVA